MQEVEIHREVLLRLPRALGIDFSITNEMVLLWLSALVTFAVLTLACRRKQLVAHGWFQNLFEAVVEFIERDVVGENIGKQGRAWCPFLLTLFFFILFSNLMGLLPFPQHVKAMTSSFSVPVGLAFIVFMVTLWINLKHHGVGGFAHKFMPAGVPWWATFLVVPIEIISWLAKPVSLAIRLCANMIAGHALLFVFIFLMMEIAWFLAALPYAGAVIMSAFEIFVSLIQAFVFTMLSAMYIRDALEQPHAAGKPGMEMQQARARQ